MCSCASVCPSSGQPAASLAPLRGDGERRELLSGRTTASLCGQSSAAQQQGAVCEMLLVHIYMWNVVWHV